MFLSNRSSVADGRLPLVWRWVGIVGVAIAAMLFTSRAEGHGSLEGGRMLQVRAAGPNGTSPAAWNDSYYTWNQNSRNFPDYASSGFSYSSYVADGKIANAGSNDGTNGTLNFSGLNTPGTGWTATTASAGGSLSLHWLATAPHDPSYFDVWLSKPGYNPTTQLLGWTHLQYLGRWIVGDASHPVTTSSRASPVDGSSMLSYDWSIGIPSDRSGRAVLLTVWQRADPAGESFWAVQDVNVTPEPATGGMLLLGTCLACLKRRREIV